MNIDPHNRVCLQTHIPSDMVDAAQNPLPRMRPVQGRWIRTDEAYACQMQQRRASIQERREKVIGQSDSATGALTELLETTLGNLPDGFERVENTVFCPDGASVPIIDEDPLGTLGQILQQDLCVLQKRGDEHVLTAAVLCFPASWTLAEKLERPLSEIHTPVAPYDAEIAKRVQRLFDGMRPGQPLWRANMLDYEDPALFQPRSESDPKHLLGSVGRYLRSEHQTLFKLPASDAVIFAIHTVQIDRAGSHHD